MADEPKTATDGETGHDAPLQDQHPHDRGKKGKKNQDDLSADKMYVKVWSPYQIFFDGDAKSISAENDTGPFDILPKHHNFMTLVNAGEVVVRAADESADKRIRISKGVMHVKANKVVLFLDV